MSCSFHSPGSRARQCLLLVAALAATCAFGQDLPVIAVLKAQDALPYRQTLESFVTALNETPQVKIVSVDDENTLQQIKNQHPELVFALGSAAVKDSRETFGNRPLLATMILSASTLDDQAQATAVLLGSSAMKQLEWHRRILPHARRVGVLYDPKESQAWLDEARAAAAKLELEIIAIPVTTPQALPAALKSLGRRADSILGIPDKTVYSSKTAKSVLLFSFRNRIPFVGMSRAWVKAGAIYGFDWDYEELGRQCASLALEIVNGTNAASIKPRLQEKQLYQLNLKTAKQLNMEISPELIAGASEVYE